MNDHLLMVSETGGGKSNVLKLMRDQLDHPSIVFDKQAGGTGDDIAASRDVVHEVLGTDKCLSMNLHPACKDEKERLIAIQMIREAIGAYRGFGATHTRVLTMDHFNPFVRVKFDTKRRFADLEDCWYQETNKRTLVQVNDPKALRWMLHAPKIRSSSARDRHPAKRFADVLSMPVIAERDQGVSKIADIFNEGECIVVTASHKCTDDEFSFYMNYRIMEIIQKKIQGEIKNNVTIICEESELAGIAPMIAKSLLGVRKYGISFWFVAQTGKWCDSEFQTTEAIWGNTNRIVKRCSSPWLLDRLVKDLSALFDPYWIKRVRRQLRQIVNGTELVDYESVTKRDKGGGSVTEGMRERNVYHRWIEETPEYFHGSEQQQLLRTFLMEMPIEAAITKIDGQVNYMRFPLWTGKKQEETFESFSTRTQERSNKWLKEVLPITHSEPETMSNDSPDSDNFDPAALF